MEAITTRWTAAVEYSSDRPVIRAISDIDTMRAFVVGLEPGQELREHPAPGDLTLIVVAGDAVIPIDGIERHASIGAVVVLPKGAPHSIRAGRLSTTQG